MGTRKRSRILQVLLVFVISAAAICPQTAVQAAAVPASQTAVLRILSSTDLHGQVSTIHYDKASDRPGSLAQVYTLIKQARKEIGAGNTMTVDVGDSVYGYAADYILNHSGDHVLQPIYKAMSVVGYDAITLGNHDFDYGYDYIEKQLSLSGLKDKCVVSNIIFTDTGKTAWNESKIITKSLNTDQGKTVKVKIGIVGISYPEMSTYSECKENLASLPIVKTVETQAAALKQQGADLVVVLAHSSFGSENPLDTANNAVYEITKLADVDAVAAGHAHKNFPSTDEDSDVFYSLPNVNRVTSLVNGKPVTMVADHGAGIGLMDLDLKIAADGKITVKNAQTSLRMVTKDTAASKAILNTQKNEIQAVDKSLNDVIGTLSDDEKIDSYFALLEDNYAVQLVNESKIQYGLAYTGGEGKSLYGDYPVVAATRYNVCGSQSAADQINLNGSITMKDILNMQQANHNNNILYWISGSQLREWLEWSASIYSTSDGHITSDAALMKLLDRYGAASIASSEWLDDWGAFAVFDGVEYTIDATKKPRYNKTGNLKNADSHRITDLTCNGQPVSDDQKFIFVSNSVGSNVDAMGTIANQKVLGKTDMAYQHLITYIKLQQEFGDLTACTDHNWDVVFDSGSQYIVRSSIMSQTEAVVKDWFRELIGSNDTFAYYLAQFVDIDTETADRDCPLLVAASTVAGETNTPVDIKVQASDRSGILQLKWTAGQEAAGSSAWEKAEAVSGGAFTVDENGIYSVMAEDPYGNRIVKCVSVTNFNPEIVEPPTINKVTNRMSILTGKAKYGTTVHINADGNTYETDALEDGTYTCTVEQMNAGRTVTVYCMDSRGRQSETVSTTVIKNGPNKPIINAVSNKSLTVTGSYSDATSTIAAIVGSKVYCSGTEGKEVYKASQLYSDSRSIKTVDYVQNGNQFEFYVPTLDAGTKVWFVALDKAGRRSSTVSMDTIDEAPNMPTVYDVCNVDNFVYGKATNVVSPGSVTVTVGSEQFTGDVQPDGSFAVQTNGLTEGQTITTAVSDIKDGQPRTSLAKASVVAPYTDFVKDTQDISIEPVYDNSLELKGHTQPGCVIAATVRGKCTRLILDEAGGFAYTLETPLMAGEEIYLTARTADGKLVAAARTDVRSYLELVPEAPAVLTNPVTFDTQQIEVLAKQPGTVIMEIDGMRYTSQDGVYNQAYDGYVYTLSLPQPAEGAQEQTITVYLMNSYGLSSSTVTVVRTKPETADDNTGTTNPDSGNNDSTEAASPDNG